MTFVKLLLVLSVLSFAKESRNKLFAKFDRIKATAPTPKNDILYFEIGSIDNDGVLQADYSKLDPLKDLGLDEFKFSNGKPYQSGTKITDPSFYAVPKEGFSELLTSRALNQSEYNCYVIYDTHLEGFYGTLGYTIKAISNVDIAPSITYVLKNYPKSVHYKLPGNVEDAALVEPQTCNSYEADYFSFSLQKTGIVGSDCVPNTVVPNSAASCTVPTGKFEQQLIGYKQAIFQGTVDSVKDALIKFGPLVINDDDFYTEIILGWDGADWVVAKQKFHQEGGATIPDYAYELGTHTISASKTDYEGALFYSTAEAEEIPPEDTKDSTLTIRAALKLITAVVIIPALALLF